MSSFSYVTVNGFCCMLVVLYHLKSCVCLRKKVMKWVKENENKVDICVGTAVVWNRMIVAMSKWLYDVYNSAWMTGLGRAPYNKEEEKREGRSGLKPGHLVNQMWITHDKMLTSSSIIISITVIFELLILFIGFRFVDWSLQCRLCHSLEVGKLEQFTYLLLWPVEIVSIC